MTFTRATKNGHSGMAVFCWFYSVHLILILIRISAALPPIPVLREFFAFFMDVVGGENLTGGRARKPVFVAQGVVHVVQPRLPVVLHGVGTEFVVFVAALVALLAVNQVNHVFLPHLGHGLSFGHTRGAAVFLRNHRQQLLHHAHIVLALAHQGGNHARAAGVLDVFNPLINFQQVFRQHTVGVP